MIFKLFGVKDLRVIAGLWRGHSLVAPSKEARPTTDRVKESMFNLMGFSWRGTTAVDLFAGSGALGIEALSRGVSEAIFIDKSVHSLQAVSENLKRCHATELGRLVRLDWKRGWAHVQEMAVDVGWVFVDPPYKLNLWNMVLEELGTGIVPILDGVVCEHPVAVVLPEQIGVLQKYKHKRYGDIGVTLYQMR